MLLVKKTQKEIKKVLIANRSEIALRIQQACRALGFKAVAVYAPEDACSRYVHSADEAYALSGCGSMAYMAQDEIIAIAHKAGADAIYPGYGFLSENALFARKVLDAGLVWVGPHPDCMELMSCKIQARKLASTAGVPVVPGAFISLNCVDNRDQAQEAAGVIGFPVIIKDPLAGGGKAMRKVHDQGELAEAWRAVAAEASRMTGASELLIEKYLLQGRHVEVQVAGDGVAAIHLFERECSIQRRHQKIIEEAPCLFVPQAILDRMYEAALALVRAVNYDSIGTVEFMVMPDGQFYFLEMNTRLQVEHSITEMTTGVDLVVLQFQLAQTGELPCAQEDIKRTGHAIECRVYAEDPANNFMPSTGIITHLQMPRCSWMRHDYDLEVFKEITPFFDPMISKVTTHGATRELAIAYMQEALRQYLIGGPVTNISFLQRLLETSALQSGAFNTQTLKDPGFIEPLIEHPEEFSGDTQAAALIAVALAQVLKQEGAACGCAQKISEHGHAQQTSAWRAQQWK